MSLFQLGGFSGGEVDSHRMQMAELEFESLAGLFDTLMSRCRTKCIPARYSEGDLNKGESVCIDRCVSKYFKSNLVVGGYLRQTGNPLENLSGSTFAMNSFDIVQKPIED
ncbi:hypothetical protein NADFUDRAFT_47965 [Nadsonia fulvescens var. elongata DSM 6958]|uniref:Mitochondrial import inner membrane translocase subunit n=1 Tax=Nadsonia fulvescens var. elongata DSM 6958 TaxID=857566 RepID=A0A1E3PF81_9ASCO|nr:hypothetical protein NADFUDRAFT_47965 [Nadsonia fulvescens var. elongata DSM 6958]